MDCPASSRLLQQEIHGSPGCFQVHEFRLAFGRRDFVLTVLVAILAGEIAMIGEIQHQCLQGKNFRRILERLRWGVPVAMTRAWHISSTSSPASAPTTPRAISS